MNIKQIYWFYKVIQSIKNNHVDIVKSLIEKYFQNDFNNYFFNLSYSYSYDCFIYFYKRLRIKNGGASLLTFYRRVNIKSNLNYEQLYQIFQQDFDQIIKDNREDFINDYEIDRLRYQIVSSLIKQNKFNIIIKLSENLSQRSKNSIFKAYLEKYTKFNEEHIKKLIAILHIEQSFFEEHVLNCYSPNLDKSLYLFIKNNYEIEKQSYINCFLRVDNQEVIAQIDKDFSISINKKIEKVHESLTFNYKYENSQKTFEIINFYQSIGYLNESTILQSLKKNYHEIIIDYTYFPLLQLNKKTEIAMLKKNINIIVFNKEYLYNYKDPDNIKNILIKLDNYFNFIKEKIDVEKDNLFIEELLEQIAVVSEDILVYFYQKFPELFIKQAFRIFTRYFNDTKDTTFIIQEILQSNENMFKKTLIEICTKALASLVHCREEHNSTYFLLKDVMSNQSKKSLLYSKISQHNALPIIKDILEQDNFKNTDITVLFLDSICGFSKNTLYLLENYNIDIETLKNGFMKLIYEQHNLINISLATKILEKHIELSHYEQYLVQEHNIELYKLSQSFNLNRKLEDKYAIKNTKEKVVKI